VCCVMPMSVCEERIHEEKRGTLMTLEENKALVRRSLFSVPLGPVTSIGSRAKLVNGDEVFADGMDAVANAFGNTDKPAGPQLLLAVTFHDDRGAA